MSLDLLAPVLGAVVAATDPTPDDNSVVAGPIGFAIFIALCLAVAFLGFSLNKHLKKAHRAADEGVYGDPAEPRSDKGPTGAE